MSTEILAALDRYIDEALTLRFGVDLPDSRATPQDVRDALVDVRARLDRIETLYSQAVRLKARARTALDAAAAIADDAWDRSVSSNRRAPVTRGDEYSTAKERHAEANLATLTLRRDVRAATELAHACTERAEVLRIAYRGLADTRHELLTVLRSYQLESNLDR